MRKKQLTAPPPREIRPRTFRGIASSTSIDLAHDRVLSWDVTSLLKNPVLLYMHDNHRPIGKITEVEREGGELVVTFQLFPAGVSADADLAYEGLSLGAIRALSIGFIPEGISANEVGGSDIKIARVFEVSLVTVPANPEALAANLGGMRSSARAQLEAAIAESFRRDREPRISARQAAAMVRKEIMSKAERELIYHAGCLDRDGLVRAVRRDPEGSGREILKALASIEQRADQIAADVVSRLTAKARA